MNALIESVSSASSVGVDDQPEMRTSPDSAAPLAAVGVGVPVPPHAVATSATTARIASQIRRFFKVGSSSAWCVGILLCADLHRHARRVQVVYPCSTPLPRNDRVHG